MGSLLRHDYKRIPNGILRALTQIHSYARTGVGYYRWDTKRSNQAYRWDTTQIDKPSAVWGLPSRSGVGRSSATQLEAILLGRIVVGTFYFVLPELFVILKRSTTVVALERPRRLTSNVSPDFRVGHSF